MEGIVGKGKGGKFNIKNKAKVFDGREMGTNRLTFKIIPGKKVSDWDHWGTEGKNFNERKLELSEGENVTKQDLIVVDEREKTEKVVKSAIFYIDEVMLINIMKFLPARDLVCLLLSTKQIKFELLQKVMTEAIEAGSSDSMSQLFHACCKIQNFFSLINVIEELGFKCGIKKLISCKDFIGLMENNLLIQLLEQLKEEYRLTFCEVLGELLQSFANEGHMKGFNQLFDQYDESGDKFDKYDESGDNSIILCLRNSCRVCARIFATKDDFENAKIVYDIYMKRFSPLNESFNENYEAVELYCSVATSIASIFCEKGNVDAGVYFYKKASSFANSKKKVLLKFSIDASIDLFRKKGKEDEAIGELLALQLSFENINLFLNNANTSFNNKPKTLRIPSRKKM